MSTVLILSLSIFGCSASKTAVDNQVSKSDDQIIFIQGSLNDRTVRHVKANLTKATTKIVVNSAGGRGSAAMQIAALANSRDLEVVVDGICLSACAHFLFLPARKRSLEVDSLVAFHQTATSIYLALKSAQRPDLANIYAPLAQQEQENYRSAGLSREALLTPFYEIEPTCYKENLSVPVGSEYRTSIYTTYAFYVPSINQLKSWGVDQVSGKWPTKIEDVARAIQRYPKPLRGIFKIALKQPMSSSRHTRLVQRCSNAIN